MRCKTRWGDSNIHCTNPQKSLGSARGVKLKHITFGSGNLLYASTGSRGGLIHVFDALKGEINELNPGHYRDRIYGMAYDNSNIKTSSTVNISFVLRTRNEYGKNKQFKKKDYHGGNFKFDKNDKYKRDIFSSTVTARNMVL
jgi:hypothetical protein